jgi:hypothetical protein
VVVYTPTKRERKNGQEKMAKRERQNNKERKELHRQQNEEKEKDRNTGRLGSASGGWVRVKGRIYLVRGLCGTL